MRNDTNWIVAGLTAALLLPGLVLAGVPLILAIGAAAIAFAGLVVFLAPRQLFEGPEYAHVDKKTLQQARELLAQARPDAARLDRARDGVKDALVRHKLGQLARIADDVLGQLAADPGKAETLRRFLTYYLPNAVELAQSFALVEAKRIAEPARLKEIAGVIDRLESAFIHYADGLTEAELGTLDADLKQIETSLKKDIER